MAFQPGALGPQANGIKYKPMPIGLDGHPQAAGSPSSFQEKWDHMFGEGMALDKLDPSDGLTSLFVRGQRKRINLVGIIVNIFLPWALFTAVYTLCSFTFHYEHPGTLWLILFVCTCFVLLIWAMGYKARTRNRTPMWWTFAGVSCTTGLVLGSVCGFLNFQYYLMPSYAINNLNTYPNTDVSADSGTQLMDVGKAYFISGTHLDFTKSMGFKNDDIYCVTPITKGTELLGSYDFWAVGLNCCSGTTADFRCGEFNNPKARSGMRLVNDDQRPFYRLAVQEAEAAYHIKANHPIFFEWVQDPVAQLEANEMQGWRLFLLGVFCFLGVNTLAVGLAIIAFSRLGQYCNQPTY